MLERRQEPESEPVVSDEAIANNGLNVLWYTNPGDLLDALSQAEPSPFGFRVAETVPDGDLIAIQGPSGEVDIRRKNRRTGQDGSERCSGEWIIPDLENPRNLVWRRWRPL